MDTLADENKTLRSKLNISEKKIKKKKARSKNSPSKLKKRGKSAVKDISNELKNGKSKKFIFVTDSSQKKEIMLLEQTHDSKP